MFFFALVQLATQYAETHPPMPSKHEQKRIREDDISTEGNLEADASDETVPTPKQKRLRTNGTHSRTSESSSEDESPDDDDDTTNGREDENILNDENESNHSDTVGFDKASRFVDHLSSFLLKELQNYFNYQSPTHHQTEESRIETKCFSGFGNNRSETSNRNALQNLESHRFRLHKWKR
eukprot:c10255_g1_i1.p1 GENE.c10255_g1_i1~~c10255_g1_i1.p1  ORF type:complete len:180 (-),score=48.53 c10255_g1_i1:15-554(-)